MKDKLQQLKSEVLEKLGGVKDEGSLRDLEVKYLGRKGELTSVLKGLKDLSDEEKREIGPLANAVKEELSNKIEQKRIELDSKIDEDAEWIDVTLPKEKTVSGHLHPLSQVQYELEDIFSSMGFMILDGPELESDYYSFEALNIPSWHPAREAQDTFYIKNDKQKMVLRPHTSSVQVRALQKYGAPLKAVVPGRVFRSEATDASHEHTFHQLEGLMVDKDISIANLIAVMKELLKGIFKRDVKVRLRPGYFPFVEPGFELDINCLICEGRGCSVCKHSGWVELLPCGLVHPNVLKYGGIDTDKYNGFAFGLGLTRLVMMRYKINDIRLIESGDLRFLNQF